LTSKTQFDKGYSTN